MTGDKLREFRESAEMSQRALARVIGVSDPTINRWEKGMAPIPLPSVKLLEFYFTGKTPFPEDACPLQTPASNPPAGDPARVSPPSTDFPEEVKFNLEASPLPALDFELEASARPQKSGPTAFSVGQMLLDSFLDTEFSVEEFEQLVLESREQGFASVKSYITHRVRAVLLEDMMRDNDPGSSDGGNAPSAATSSPH